MNPIKVVYNACYGGYSLSKKATERLAQLGVMETEAELREVERMLQENPVWKNLGEHYYLRDLPRHDPRLVQVVEELGEESGGTYADLKIHLLKGDRYRIDEYDGRENVQEPEDIVWVHVEN
jgi:hypothetical protein